MKKTLKYRICLLLALFPFFLGELHAQGNYFFNTGDFFDWQGRTGTYVAKNSVPATDVEPKYANRYSVFVFKNPLITYTQIPFQRTTIPQKVCETTIPDNRYDYRFTLLDSANLSGNDRFDGYTNYHLPKVPPGYRYAAKIGNTCNRSEAEGLVHAFTPTTFFEMLVVKYAMVFPSPHNENNSEEEKEKNPPFELSIETKNANGDWEISSASQCAYTFVNSSKSILATDSAYHKDGLVVNGHDSTIYRTWTTIGVDLTQFINTPVRLLVSSGDCSPGGHWGYSYLTGVLTDSRPSLDYSTICQNPDSDIVGSIYMAEGFKYEWTIKDSSTVLSTERSFNVPESLMNSDGERLFTCAISSARTDYPDSLKPICIRVPKKQDKLIENYRAVVSIVDTVMCDQTVHFKSTSKVFNAAALVPNKYEWNFGDGTPTVTADTVISHKYAKPGPYRVSLLVHTNHPVTGECARREYFDIVVPETPKPKIIGPTEVCKNAPTILTAQGGLWRTDPFDYTWKVNGQVVSTTSTLNYQYDSTALVTLIAKNPKSMFNCTDSITVRMKVIDNPIIIITADTSICFGNKSTIAATSNNGVKYVWSNGKTEPTIIEKPKETTTYTVTVTNRIGCSSSASVTVKVMVPKVTASTLDTCAKDPVTLFATGADIYEWSSNPNDATLLPSMVNDSTITVYPNQTTTYTLIGKSTMGCKADPINTTVKVSPYPVPKFSMTPTYIDFENPSATFIDISTYGVNREWDFGDGATSKDERIIHTYQNLPNQDSILITLTSYNLLNCFTILKQNVPIEIFAIWAPNAFAPSQIGTGNGFFQLITRNTLKDFQLKIYDRWGQEVFSSTDPTKGWDGTKKGKELPAGAYNWISSYKRDNSDRTYQQKGVVNLIR